jgi:type I restriction-modification system DNA methylase subunit
MSIGVESLFGEMMREPYTKNSITPEKTIEDQTHEDLTPSIVAELAASLLELNNEDALVDLGAHQFNFINAASKHAEQALYIGVEIHEVPEWRYLSERPTFHEEEDGTIVIDDISLEGRHVGREQLKYIYGDLFSCGDEIIEATEGRTRKVFCQPPLKLPMSQFMGDLSKAESIASQYSNEVLQPSEWLYAAAAVDLMGSQGRAVVVLPKRAVAGAKGKAARKAFVDAGLIEAVIEIPKLMLPYDDPRSIIVFSHNNKNVRFIDAHLMAKPDSPFTQNTSRIASGINFSAIISEILELCSRKTKISKSISFSDIKELDYSLDAELFTGAAVIVKRGSQLGNVGSIRRGTPKKNLESLEPITAKDEDDYLGQLRGNMIYLSLSAFQDGEIFDYQDSDRDVLEYTLVRDDNIKKLGLMQGDRLLISRTGYPFKVGLAKQYDSNSESFWTYLSVSDNVFAIEVNKEINPVYLLAFFGSDIGQRVLRQAARGAGTKQITARDLAELRIPIPSRKEQDEIAKDYSDYQKEIQDLNRRLKTIENRKRKLMGIEVVELSPDENVYEN